MLKRSELHQAHGLQAWELRPPTRVLPVVSSAPDTRSLELLCRLEQSFRQLALPLVVLEGWRGLRPQDALAGHQAVMRHWLAGVPAGSVVLLHAPLEPLSVLLADSMARPLVAMDETPAALVQAYNAVKVLHQVAALEPVVVALQPAPAQGDRLLEAPGPLLQATQALQHTCQQQWAWVPVVWTLEYHFNGAALRDAGAALATRLKLLDSALLLEDPVPAHPGPPCHLPPTEQTFGALDVHRQRYA